MKLKIAAHASLEVPSALIAPPEPNVMESSKEVSPKTPKALIRRSAGLLSVTSVGAIPYFLMSQDLIFAVGSAALLAGSSLPMIFTRKYKVRDFFPKFKAERPKAEVAVSKPVLFTPYKNWDNAFLPYAGEVVNIGYKYHEELPKGALLEGSAMGQFYVWMNISSEIEKRKILKNFYGEIDNVAFWSSMYCHKAVRFYEE